MARTGFPLAPIIAPIKTPQEFFRPAIQPVVPARTSVQFVQYATSGNGSAATGATFGNTLGIGNLIVVAVSSTSASINTPTDTAGHVYVPSGAGTAHNATSTQFLAVFYTVVTVAQAADVVVCSNGASSHIYEFSGVQRVSPVDVTAIVNEQTTVGTAPNNQQVGPMTTTLPDLVFVAMNDNTGSPTAGTLTVPWIMNAPGTDGVGSEYYIQTQSNTITGAMSDPSAADTYCMIMVGFKPAFSVDVFATGNQITSTAGTVTESGGAIVSATGSIITSAVGTVSVVITGASTTPPNSLMLMGVGS